MATRPGCSLERHRSTMELVLSQIAVVSSNSGQELKVDSSPLHAPVLALELRSAS